MLGDPRSIIERNLLARRGAVVRALRLLPSAAWAKGRTLKRRDRLAAQLREIDKQLYDLRQIALFPSIQRLRSPYA